jgi:integrase
MENVAIGEAAPNTVNSSVRTREYLTEAEIERLMAAARKSSRYGHRDATMILIGYRHGLRAAELCDLQWSQVELNTGRLHIRRAKNGSPSVHPLQGDEIRALRRLQREQGPSSHVFMTERDGPMTPKAFHALFGRIGARARMPFPIHPHMLRHGCGYALANAGHDTRALQAWLGHKPHGPTALRQNLELLWLLERDQDRLLKNLVQLRDGCVRISLRLKLYLSVFGMILVEIANPHYRLRGTYSSQPLSCVAPSLILATMCSIIGGSGGRA